MTDARLLTVCTGNICRSPLAAQVLRARLDGLAVTVASAGTHALADAPMTPEAQRLAVEADALAGDPEAHRARLLAPVLREDHDLVLALAREHRRYTVEESPALVRRTFTVREFARLAASVDDDEIRAAVSGETDASARVRSAAARVASRRGQVEPPADPADDDVIDPYRRSWETYELSASQLLPAIDEVARVVRVALSA